MSGTPRAVPQKLGKYEVRREVGRGGMGIVYEGFDPLISRRVALKTFLNEFFDGTQADNLLTRLRREAQAAGRLSHPNIIAVYDYGEETVKDEAGNDNKTAYIAMEFIEGRSLESYFQASERFPAREVVRIMSELLDALQYSHSHGVVHRDVKPANIILLADGTVKVADFGVARIESSTLTQFGTVLGSPSYMSPEQFMGQTVDGRSDLYSAGVVLYQLLTSEVPFTGGAFTTIMHKVLNETPAAPSVLNVQVPKGFDTLLSKAMAKRPDERYQSADEFKQAVIAAGAAAPESMGVAGGTVLRSAAAAPAGAARAGTAQAGTAQAGAAPVPSRAISPAVLFTVLGLLLAGSAGAYYYWQVRPAAGSGTRLTADSTRADAPPGTTAQTQTPPPSGAGNTAATPDATYQSSGGTTVISAVGLASAADGNGADPAAAISADARRQVIAKAAALYVQPSSLHANYAVVNAKLLTRSDDFITTVLEQPTTQTTKDGVSYGVIKAAVSVRDVQKSLNQISHDERVEFIRNNGNPRISVSVHSVSPDADSAAPPQESAAAENLLKERIRSFGFTVVADESAKPPADFHVDGEVRFKKLSARLPASGLTIEKFVITSWTVRAIDAKTGEEIYHNTAIPEKQSWASQELALQDVGRLIGAEFSQSFFLQYFDFKPKKARLRFSGLPPSAAHGLLDEVNSSLVVLNAALAPQQGGDVVIDADVSAADSATVPSVVQQSILGPLNRKMGSNCFTLLEGGGGTELHITFAATCGAAVNRLDMAPTEALGKTTPQPPVSETAPRYCAACAPMSFIDSSRE